MDWKQRALYQLMSDISEEGWFASWLTGNEYALWEVVSDPKADRNYGRCRLTDEQVEELRAISTEIGGWIRWRDDEEDPNLPNDQWGPVFTPMAEWLPMYERRMAAWAGIAAL